MNNKKMNFAFKRPEDSPGFLLWQLTNQWQRQQRKALAQLKLTHAQFVVLAALLWLSETSEHAVTQQHIVQLTKIDKMMMSDLTATLSQKKLLRIALHKKDARAYALNLTNKGRNLVLKAIPIVEDIDANFFTEETTHLMHLLHNLRHLVRN